MIIWYIILVWVWLGTVYLVMDGSRWPWAIRLASFIVYSIVAAIAVTHIY